MQLFHAFAGPYLEILTPPGTYPGGIEGMEAEYDRLYSVENSRLRWLKNRGDPVAVKVRRRRVWRHCAFPQRKVPGVPRWPMFFDLGYGTSGENAVVDLQEADVAAEMAWFERAFAAEVDLVRRVAIAHGFDHGVRWGMGCSVY